MSEKIKKMKPIWYFVGIVMLVMGGIILLEGIYEIVRHVESKTVLARLHPNLWWGGIMVIVGAVFILTNRNVSVD